MYIQGRNCIYKSKVNLIQNMKEEKKKEIHNWKMVMHYNSFVSCSLFMQQFCSSKYFGHV